MSGAFTRRTIGVKLGLGLLLSLSLLLLGESFARVVRTVIDEMSAENDVLIESYLTGSPEFGWVREPGFTGRDIGGTAWGFDAEGYFTADSQQAHASTDKKVAFIGASNTFGYGVDVDSTFAQVTEHLLSHIDAINLGVPGYSSYQGLHIVQKYIPTLRPAVAVIEFNFNDRRYATLPDGPEQFARISQRITDRWRFYLQQSLQYSYLYRGLRRVLRLTGWALAEEPQVVNVDSLTLRVDEAAYRRNLSAMALYCRQHGVRPIFLLLRDDPFETEPIRTGIAKLNSGDAIGAIRELNGVIKIGSDLSTVARHYLAKALRQIGATKRADDTLNLSKAFATLDGEVPARLDADYSQIMQEVAHTDSVDIIDAATMLESTPVDVFEDLGHINKEGHRLVGELIAAKLSTLPELSTQGTGKTSSPKAQ
jgi:lysophospholipase L1-like esterase